MAKCQAFDRAIANNLHVHFAFFDLHFAFVSWQGPLETRQVKKGECKVQNAKCKMPVPNNAIGSL